MIVATPMLHHSGSSSLQPAICSARHSAQKIARMHKQNSAHSSQQVGSDAATLKDLLGNTLLSMEPMRIQLGAEQSNCDKSQLFAMPHCRGQSAPVAADASLATKTKGMAVGWWGASLQKIERPLLSRAVCGRHTAATAAQQPPPTHNQPRLSQGLQQSTRFARGQRALRSQFGTEIGRRDRKSGACKRGLPPRPAQTTTIRLAIRLPLVVAGGGWSKARGKTTIGNPRNGSAKNSTTAANYRLPL